MTIAPIFAYSMDLEFRDSQNDLCVSSIHAFLAKDDRDAILSAHRFWVDRQRALSEHFGKLLCLKVHSIQIGPITAEGELMSRTLWRVFEWKDDFPGSLMEHIELALAEARRLK